MQKFRNVCFVGDLIVSSS